ncbi:ranBP2-type zinc finger protein At1g67325 [Arachis duranensis]|uniref:RanBP2-type zinc finger protein At1g67325 n=1 Tax=Arachis duranensis TaxID=130453 RepID=A0A6P4BUV7_ARADU|nr:ranBP2-type zinc finger protein At1g67325 [Arachis duranensis]
MSWSGGDWMCGACQHINFKKREACQNCGYPKFGGPDPSTYRYHRTEALAGDWFCTGMNCGAHNYASRSNCYRCGAFKDKYSSHIIFIYIWSIENSISSVGVNVK